MPSYKHIARETFPRHQRGIDFGADGRVLARTEDSKRFLVIVPGYKSALGARGFGQEYQPARLMIVKFDKIDWMELKEGRISTADILSLHDKIDPFFKAPVSKLVKLTQTLVLSS